MSTNQNKIIGLIKINNNTNNKLYIAEIRSLCLTLTLV